MRHTTRILASFLLVALMPTFLLAVNGKKAAYIGGTAGLSENSEGLFSTISDHNLTFTPDRKGLSNLSVPYTSITTLEYGQKAGRRVAVAVLITPFALFSKKRNHYLTLSYNDTSGKEQAAVFELGKDIVRTTIKVLEVRSGKKIEYQDDEARKAGMGGS